jgi:maleylpyruvate isomerase
VVVEQHLRRLSDLLENRDLAHELESSVRIVPADDVDVASYVAGVRRSQAALEEALLDVEDEVLRGPSLLPGWTRGHVLTHVARNADGATRMLRAAAQGVVGEQYPGGMEERNADIEAGSGRPAAEIVEDVITSARRLDAAIDAMPQDAWTRDVRFLRTGIQPAWRCVFTRWREVEIHWSDLGPERSPAAWPTEFVEAYLGRELTRLPGRLPADITLVLRSPGYDGSYGAGSRTVTVAGPPYAIYAWLTGRPEQVSGSLHGELPEIGPWA